MDIALVVKRTTLYALLTMLITIGYIGTVLFVNWLFGGIIGLQTLITAILPALLIAFAFAPLKEGIQVFIDRTLFKKRYDHRKILSNLSRMLTSIFSLEELLRLLLRVITEAMGIEGGVIYLPKEPRGLFVPMASHGNGNSSGNGKIIEAGDPLIEKVNRRRELVLREELERLPQSIENRSIVDLMAGMGVDICIPIFSKDSLSGLIFLGSKETGESFTSEDIDMFTTLSHHVAVAIENARLYTKVEESKIYQEILLNSLTSGVVAVDLNSRITAFNRKAEAMLGIKADKAMGRSIDLISSEFSSILRDALRRGEPSPMEEVVLRREGGKEIPLAVSSSIFNGYDGKTLGALIVFSDLTERKILEAEMRRADRLASLGTLAAGMAHEIKNPLVSLKTFTQLLPEKYSDREFRENFAKLANQEVDRINYLVEQLLDFARPTSPMFREIDLAEILENTLFLLGSKFIESGVELRKDIPERPLRLMADGDQLKQVFLNIVINAMQAMEKGGVLTVRAIPNRQGGSQTATGRGGRAHRKMRQLMIQNQVIVEVADTGKGIDPKDLPHLFDPFFTTRGEGVGLGLAIAHSIIGEHGGVIDVKSRVGEGTSFFITLPLVMQGDEKSTTTIKSR